MRPIDQKLIKACQNGDIHTAQKLLEQGANPNIQEDYHPWRKAIHIAAENGYTPIIALLIQYGAKPHTADHNGQTALHHAVENLRYETTEYLLAQLQLDPNTQNQWGRTPFMIATENGGIKILRLLIQHGANPFIPPDGWNALHCAVARKNHNIARYLLTQLQFDPNSQNRQGITPLLIAAQNGDIDMIRLLIRHGANPYATDQNGRNALHYAAECGNPKVVSFLITDLHLDPNQQDHNGDTPLFLALQNDDARTTKILIQLGANPHIPNHQGEKSTTLARQYRIRLPKTKPSTITL